MTDICPQSINLIKENIQLNKQSFPHNMKSFSANFLEWGKHDITKDETETKAIALDVNDDKKFPSADQKGTFDLILASDVIYFAGCLAPLASCISHFLKPLTGRCLVVSEAMRYDVFSDRFEAACKSLKLLRLHKELINFKGHNYHLQIL